MGGWGAEAGGPRVLRRSNTPGARLQEERGGESEASGDRLLDGVPSSAARASLAAGRGLQEAEARGARSSGPAARAPRHLVEIGFSETPCPGEGEQKKFSPFPGALSFCLWTPLLLSSLCSLSPFRSSLFPSSPSPLCAALSRFSQRGVASPPTVPLFPLFLLSLFSFLPSVSLSS